MQRCRKVTGALDSRNGGNTIPQLAFVCLGVVSQLYDTGPHPEVRAAQLQPQLMRPERYSNFERAKQAYAIAAAMPHLVDGLYCHCDCEGHSGHYSLLDCYASDHAAACDVCMKEVEIAFAMSQDGATLDDIRSELNRVYGT